jgi:hypothetical protein
MMHLFNIILAKEEMNKNISTARKGQVDADMSFSTP